MAIQRGRAVGRPDGVRTAPGSGRECVRRSTRLCRGSRRRRVGWHASMLSPQGCATPARPPQRPRYRPPRQRPLYRPPRQPSRYPPPRHRQRQSPRPWPRAQQPQRPPLRSRPRPGRHLRRIGSGCGSIPSNRRQKAGELTELSATATAISAKPRGELVITLDNGQVWGEIAPGSKIKVKPGDAVKIEAGTLGSFILIAPNGRSSKVTRIR